MSTVIKEKGFVDNNGYNFDVIVDKDCITVKDAIQSIVKDFSECKALCGQIFMPDDKRYNGWRLVGAFTSKGSVIWYDSPNPLSFPNTEWDIEPFINAKYDHVECTKDNDGNCQFDVFIKKSEDNMRGPNKMPQGYRPSKRGLKQKYTKHVSVDMSESDFEFVELLASYLHISRAEAVRRCIEGAKLQLTLISTPKGEEK